MKRKNVKIYVLGAALILGAQLGLVSCSSTNSDGVSTGAVSDQTISGESEKADTQNKSSDNLFDCTFTLNGETYTLPCSVQSFTQEGGWVYDVKSYSEDTEVASSSYEKIYLNDGEAIIKLEIYNSSKDVQKVKDCEVAGIEIYQSKDTDLLMAKGISFDSSKEQVLSAYGSVEEENIDDNTLLVYYSDKVIDLLNDIYYVDETSFKFDSSGSMTTVYIRKAMLSK